MDALLDGLDVLADGPDRDDRVARLVACPLPLMAILNADGRFAATRHPGASLEVLTRRYYKIRELHDVRIETLPGEFEAVRASYTRRDRAVDVVALRSRPGDVAAALTAASSAVAGVGVAPGEPPRTAVIDVYVALGSGRNDDLELDDPDALAARFEKSVAEAPLAPFVTRVAFIVARAERGLSGPLFTFRRAGPEGVQPYWMLDAAAPDALDSAALLGGRDVPRLAPDDRPTAADVAAVQLRDHPAAVAR